MAEPSTSPVLTQSGWFPLMDIVEGDRVLGSSGRFRRVIRAEGYRRRRLHSLALADGSSLFVTMDQNWSAQVENEEWTMLSTLEISEALEADKLVCIPVLMPPPVCPVDPVFPVMQTRGQRVALLKRMLGISGEQISPGLFFVRTNTWRVAAMIYNLSYSLGAVFAITPGRTHPTAAPEQIRTESPATIDDVLAVEVALALNRTEQPCTYEGHVTLPGMFPLTRQVVNLGRSFELDAVDITLEGGFPYVTKDWVVTGGV